jgi:hypothetical protein
MTAVEVSPLVNSPKNNNPEVLEPFVTNKVAPAREQRGLFDD